MRIVIVGAPRAGKSTLAEDLRIMACVIPHLCADPKPLVKDPLLGVEYLPDEFAEKGRWSDASQFVVDNWMDRDNYVLEGVSMARVLRKYHKLHGKPPQLDRLIVMYDKHPQAPEWLPGQAAMAQGVKTVLAGFFTVCPELEAIAEYL